MHEYNIHLNTLREYRLYVGLLRRFAFGGFIRGKGFSCDADDILKLFEHCPSGCLVLYVHTYPEGVCREIETYLAESGLLNFCMADRTVCRL